MPMSWDIVRRVKRDFAEADVGVALAILERAKAKNPGWTNRILRCALYLAEGDLDALRQAIALGRSDWRDLIVAGEQSWRRRRKRAVCRFFGCPLKIPRRRKR